MTRRATSTPEPSPSDALLALLVERDAEEWKAMSEAERERELVEMGYDSARLDAAIVAAFERAGLDLPAGLVDACADKAAAEGAQSPSLRAGASADGEEK